MGLATAIFPPVSTPQQLLENAYRCGVERSDGDDVLVTTRPVPIFGRECFVRPLVGAPSPYFVCRLLHYRTRMAGPDIGAEMVSYLRNLRPWLSDSQCAEFANERRFEIIGMLDNFYADVPPDAREFVRPYYDYDLSKLRIMEPDVPYRNALMAYPDLARSIGEAWGHHPLTLAPEKDWDALAYALLVESGLPPEIAAYARPMQRALRTHRGGGAMGNQLSLSLSAFGALNPKGLPQGDAWSAFAGMAWLLTRVVPTLVGTENALSFVATSDWLKLERDLTSSTWEIPTSIWNDVQSMAVCYLNEILAYPSSKLIRFDTVSGYPDFRSVNSAMRLLISGSCLLEVVGMVSAWNALAVLQPGKGYRLGRAGWRRVLPPRLGELTREESEAAFMAASIHETDKSLWVAKSFV